MWPISAFCIRRRGAGTWVVASPELQFVFKADRRRYEDGVVGGGNGNSFPSLWVAKFSLTSPSRLTFAG